MYIYPMKVIILIILFASVTTTDASQYELRASELHFHKHSLSNDYIYASPLGILKTREGTLWLTFETFVLKKQGNKLTRYDLPVKPNRYGSSKAIVKSIEYQSKPIFSYKGILFSYDPENDKLFEWKKLDSESDTITDLLVSSDGKLWVSSLNSVQFLNGINSDFSSIHYFDNRLSNSIYEDDKGNIWVGTFLASLYKIYDNANPSEPAIVEMHQLSTSDPIQINDIKQVNAEELLLGTSLGLFRFILKTKTVQKIATPKAIQAIDKMIVNETKLWIHASDQIFVQNRQTNSYSSIDLMLDMEQETNEPRVKSIYIDDEEILWASLHNAGLYSYSKFRNRFAKLSISPKTNLSKSIPVFYPLDHGQFLIGNGLTTYVSNFEAPLAFKTTAYHVGKSTNISLASGKNIYFLEQKKIDKLALPGRFFSDINSMTVKDNNLWVTTELEGLHKFKIQNDSLLGLPIQAINTLKILYVTQLINGNIVLFSPFSIAVYKDSEGFLELVENISLRYEIIKIEEKSGMVFSHLSDGSISRFNLSNRNISNHQFEKNNIGCVVNDGGNIWWLAEIGGAAIRIDESLNQIKLYNQFDGIPAGGLNGEVCQEFNNQIIFSSYQGLVTTSLAINDKNSIKPTVNLEWSLGRSNRQQSKSDHIRAGIKQQDFPIRFFIFQSSLVSPSRNTLQYRLAPINKEWLTANNDNSVIDYQKLPPGKYSFNYRAINNSGIESDVKTSNFIVLPSLWLTWWAKLFYIIIIILLIWLIFRIRLQSIKNRAASLEVAIADRTEELSAKKSLVDNLLREKQLEISNVSHEFRTPLTLILGPINQLLKRKDLFANDGKEMARNKLTLVKNNANRLLRMVEQLLQLESFKLNKIALLEKQNSHAIINFIVDSFQELAIEKEVTLTKGVIADARIFFVPDALEKVIINLVSNAIKYTPKGGEVVIQSDLDSNNFLIITVSDSGIGIADNMKGKVFDRFQRANGEDSSQIAGSGIGLALVKEIVDSHGGHIVLTSELNIGTKVTISLPLKQNSLQEDINQHQPLMNRTFIKQEVDKISQIPNTIQQPKIEREEDNNIILVVEDNIDMRNYIIEGLADSYTCLTASDGVEGFELAKESIPDLIVSDVMMPAMNGYELTEKLKMDSKTNHIPIVLLTALNDQNSRLTGLSRKADDYLTKPFDTEELAIRISNLIEIRTIMKSKFLNTLFAETEVTKITNASISHENHDQAFIVSLEEIISDNYRNPEIKISDISSKMFMSQRQLLRKFKGVLDISPAEYLRRYRLEKARELIASGKPPGNVALEVGFSSHTHFGKCFKAQFGCAPSKYEP